jgi:hypothetical protein
MNNLQMKQQLLNTQKHLQKLNIDPYQNPTRPYIYQLRLAKRNLQQQRREAALHRQNHLTFQQEILVLQEKKSQAAAVATIQRTERRARCFRKFHTYTKPNSSTSDLAYVITTNNAGEKKRIQNPVELQEILYHRNRKHFAQADGTPFTRPPLSTRLNINGVSDFGTKLLNGEPTNTCLPPTTNAILSELKRARSPLPHQMTLQEMIRGFSKWRESVKK